MSKDQKAQEAVESRDVKLKPKTPGEPAGPHAKEHLIDREKTPGSGSLPDAADRDADVGPD